MLVTRAHGVLSVVTLCRFLFPLRCVLCKLPWRKCGFPKRRQGREARAQRQAGFQLLGGEGSSSFLPSWERQDEGGRARSGCAGLSLLHHVHVFRLSLLQRSRCRASWAQRFLFLFLWRTVLERVLSRATPEVFSIRGPRAFVPEVGVCVCVCGSGALT